MSTEMMLDALVAVLLAGTIVYAMILNRRLKAVREGKEELLSLIQAFNQATEKARASTDGLRQLGDGTASRLHDMVGEARALRDDLGFLIERGGVIADRLEGDVSAARDGSARGEAAKGTSRQDTISEVERNLRKVLEATR